MQLIDEAKIYVKSGDGGNGKVSFRREKFVEFGGPDGGHGGNGGNVLIRSDHNLNTLLHFRYQQHFKADNGESGSNRNKAGKAGENVVINVPIGTQIFDEYGDLLIYDFVRDNEEFEILRGGKGGAGNSVFKSSANQSPKNAVPGEEGQEMCIWLKLKILSDIGLIGLPNAGKSTFLSKVTNAKPKIADYPFTTLSPNIGIVEVYDSQVVIADIPGLIEGAHTGRGLGDKFLKHIERCKILIHLIDGTEDVVESFDIIRDELEQYSTLLAKKPYVLCINKIDIIDEDELADKVRRLSKHAKNKIHTISTHENKGLREVISAAMNSHE